MLLCIYRYEGALQQNGQGDVLIWAVILNARLLSIKRVVIVRRRYFAPSAHGLALMNGQLSAFRRALAAE